MAKQLKGNGADEPGFGHNLGDMKRDLMLAAQEISRIDAEIAGLRERKAEIKHEKVKAHGIKLADFNTVLRWWNLESEDRDQTIDNIRICCEALGVGGQGELFPTPAEIGATKGTRAEARA